MDQVIQSFQEFSQPKNLAEYQAHQLIYPAWHSRYEESEDYREAGVLVSLVEEAGVLVTKLIQRTAVGTHASQIAFPGGAREPEDADLAQTALREFREEVGGAQMEIISELTPVYISVSNFKLTPYVAYSPESDPTFTPEESEVAAIFSLPIHTLIELPIVENTVEVGNLTMHVNSYEYGGYVIWGATAMILAEFQILCKNVFSQSTSEK